MSVDPSRILENIESLLLEPDYFDQMVDDGILNVNDGDSALDTYSNLTLDQYVIYMSKFAKKTKEEKRKLADDIYEHFAGITMLYFKSTYSQNAIFDYSAMSGLSELSKALLPLTNIGFSKKIASRAFLENYIAILSAIVSEGDVSTTTVSDDASRLFLLSTEYALLKLVIGFLMMGSGFYAGTLSQFIILQMYLSAPDKEVNGG